MDTNLMHEPQKSKMIKPAMNYGLFFGLILVAFSVLTWVLNLTMEKYISIINYILIIVCLYFFSKKYKDEYEGNFISYGKVMKFNSLMLIFVSFIIGFYTFIFFKFIEPEMIERILEKTRETMLEKNSELSEEQIDVAINMQKKFMTPIVMFVSSMIGTYIMGILFSLITSIFLMKKDKTIENNSNSQ